MGGYPTCLEAVWGLSHWPNDLIPFPFLPFADVPFSSFLFSFSTRSFCSALEVHGPQLQLGGLESAVGFSGDRGRSPGSNESILGYFWCRRWLWATFFTWQPQWRIQDFCEGDAAGVWPPIFFGRDDPTFYGRLLARIGVARIFRGWVRPGVDPGFLVGGRWRGRRPRARRGRREAHERRRG